MGHTLHHGFAAALVAAETALSELENIRWEDIWKRVDASGDDDLARYSEKYLGYVRRELTQAIDLLRSPTEGSQ